MELSGITKKGQDGKEDEKKKELFFPDDERIEWIEIQEAQVRVKRDGHSVHIHHHPTSQMLHPNPRPRLHQHAQLPLQQFTQTNARFDDELFIHQWYLGTNDQKVVHMNVHPVWEMGYSGKGVVVSIVDDGEYK